MNSTHADSVNSSLHVLKIDECLPPINRWTFIGGWCLIGAIALTVGLSSVVRYNVAVKANAVVRPAGELRVVQAEMDGTVAQIEVSENQTVRRGDVIAVLDDMTLQTQKSQLNSSIQQSQIQLNQLDSQIQLMRVQVLAESQAVEREIASRQTEMSRSQHDYQERLKTAQADVEEAQASLELAQDQLTRYQQLANSGAIAQAQLKERESAVEIARARLERAKAFLNPSQSAIALAQEQIAQQRARGMATIANLEREQKSLAQRRAEIQSQILRDQKELQQVEQRLEESIIRATSDGVIFQLSLLNAGQVIRIGDSVAQIAPTDTPLVIKASVPNQDIDKVAVGQRVQIRVNACSYTDYGTLGGTVAAIAPDSSTSSQSSASGVTQRDAAQSNNRTFEATIQVETNVMSKGGRDCTIQPGMDAIASIISRDETFLRFVLQKLRLFTNL